MEDLVIKYAPDLPPVLHGISFELSARERVGLLGRTGAYLHRVNLTGGSLLFREWQVNAGDERASFCELENSLMMLGMLTAFLGGPR